ncbi:hypothetical protein NDN08_006539 [Rhodosorus marinus]|uniref:Mediator of RNA polymerase II transcription subunit 19 n=1 Tax=Rhodosorus marinus TaxID=101924 RepID=A0AAV8UKY7_9RHOD|nr:hypothetical protein NDN08_006539 [Rhodosorus marinus]
MSAFPEVLASTMFDAADVPVGTDLLEYSGLRKDLNELKQLAARGKMRSSFSHLIADIPGEDTPINPKCSAGSICEVALQPAAEDERNFEPFDERALRLALVLSEDKEPIPQPAWLKIDQAAIGDEKKRRKKKKKKRRKRGNDTGDDKYDSERRSKRRRKEGMDSDGIGLDTDADNVANMS